MGKAEPMTAVAPQSHTHYTLSICCGLYLYPHVDVCVCVTVCMCVCMCVAVMCGVISKRARSQLGAWTLGNTWTTRTNRLPHSRAHDLWYMHARTCISILFGPISRASDGINNLFHIDCCVSSKCIDRAQILISQYFMHYFAPIIIHSIHLPHSTHPPITYICCFHKIESHSHSLSLYSQFPFSNLRLSTVPARPCKPQLLCLCFVRAPQIHWVPAAISVTTNCRPKGHIFVCVAGAFVRGMVECFVEMGQIGQDVSI